MSKTALELLNEVGKNLRRSTGATYTALDQNGDTIFMMQALNEAKRMVESRWKWDVLQDAVIFATDGVADTFSLSTGSLVLASGSPAARERAEVVRDATGRPLFWDVTDARGGRVSICTKDYALQMRTMNPLFVERPATAAVYPNGTGLSVLFPYPPAGVRQYKLVIKNPQEDLVNDNDTLLIPWRPVVLAATAICFDERGEELGGDSNRWWERYEDSLSEEMGRDIETEDMVLMPLTNPFYWKN